jgi:hypothetical protein
MKTLSEMLNMTTNANEAPCYAIEIPTSVNEDAITSAFAQEARSYEKKNNITFDDFDYDSAFLILQGFMKAVRIDGDSTRIFFWID